MPIWLRNFTFNKLKQHYDEKAKADAGEEAWISGEARQEASKNKTIQIPDFLKNAKK